MAPFDAPGGNIGDERAVDPIEFGAVAAIATRATVLGDEEWVGY